MRKQISQNVEQTVSGLSASSHCQFANVDYTIEPEPCWKMEMVTDASYADDHQSSCILCYRYQRINHQDHQRYIHPIRYSDHSSFSATLYGDHCLVHHKPVKHLTPPSTTTSTFFRASVEPVTFITHNIWCLLGSGMQNRLPAILMAR